MPRAPFVSCLLWVFLCIPAAAQGSADEDGAVASVNRWYTSGGCAARTGATLSRPVTGATEAAWRQTVSGEIESEPLVWDDVIVVAAKTSDKERILHVLRLRDGRPLAKRIFKTTESLEPSIWGTTIVVRAGPTRLEAFAVTKDALAALWAHDLEAAISAPLFFEHEVYVRAASAVLRLRVGRSRPLWRTAGAFRGRPSLRGAHVYLGEYDGVGSVKLSALKRSTGERAASQLAGFLENGGAPPEGCEPTAHVFATRVMLDNRALLGSEPADLCATASLLSRTPGANESLALFGGAMLPLTHGIAGWQKREVFTIKDRQDGPLLLATDPKDLALPVRGESQYMLLASTGSQAPFVQAGVAPTIAGGTVYVGAQAFDLDSREIVWAGDCVPRFRIVPARATLLAVDGPSKIVAWRAARLADSRPSVALPAAAAPLGRIAVTGGFLVLDDGSLSKGDFELDAAKSQVLRPDLGGKTKKTFDLAGVLIAADATRKILYAAPGEGAMRGMRAWAAVDTAGRYVALALEAVAAGAAADAERWVDEARQRGATEAQLAGIEAKLDTLAKKPSEPRAAAVAALREKAKTFERSVIESLWMSTGTLDERCSPSFARDLIGNVLELDADYPQAVAKVRSLLPREIGATDPFRARDWLQFVEATRFVTLRLVQPPARDAGSAISHEERELGSLLGIWRKDLFGLASKQLFVVTPAAAPGRIARCLSMGELVCDTLDEIFANGGKRRDTRYPLMMHLFESQDEFIREWAKLKKIPPEAAAQYLEWQAGHYDIRENLMRIYLPQDELEFEEVMNTYAHEVTHHWIAERCPLFSTADRDKGLQAPGYWIVEGFATLVQEFRFDMRARTCETLNRRARSLDVVASATPEQLLPWPLLYTLTHGAFAVLPKEMDTAVPLRWHVGAVLPVSAANLFYMQGAATCHYLFHAEGGKHRPALLDYLARHYTGACVAGEIEKVFGMSEIELGKRVVAWAKETVAARD
jgi:hypothetical protein